MKRHSIRMLLTAVLLVMALGSTALVYGDTLAGGKVLTNPSKPTTTTAAASNSTTGTGATGGSPTSASPGYVTSGTGTATGAAYRPSATTASTGTMVQTGYLEDAMPFMIVMGMGIFLLLAFSHLQLNQTRYGKSEKYAKELKDFRRACRVDR